MTISTIFDQTDTEMDSGNQPINTVLARSQNQEAAGIDTSQPFGKALGKVFSKTKGRDSARKRKLAAEKAIAQAQRRKEVRNAIRRTRQAYGQQLSLSVAAGGGIEGAEASAFSGAAGGTQSQLTYNLSFLDTMAAFNEQLRVAEYDLAKEEASRARKQQSRSNAFGFVSTVASFF